METIFEKAQQHFNEGKYELAKNCLDEYLSNFFFNEIQQLQEFIYDIKYYDIGFNLISFYLEILSNINNVKLSEIEQNARFIELKTIKQTIAYKQSKGLELTEKESNVSKMLEYKFDFHLNWGIHAGSSIFELLVKETEYLLWCIINLDHVIVPSMIFCLPIVQQQPTYHEALTANMIKLCCHRDYSYTEPSEEYEDEYDSNDDWESSSEKYGDAYGYDDDTIDSAFEGDPENYWNID
jgi:hypothetical protein